MSMNTTNSRHRDEPSERKSARGKVKSDFPKDTLTDAVKVVSAMVSATGGQPIHPNDLAIALGISPGSSVFRQLLSSANKYGLITGTYQSDRIRLTDRGEQVGVPTSAEEKHEALLGALLSPKTFHRIFEHLKGRKIPAEAFFANMVVRDFGVPTEHARRCVAVFLANVESLGLVRVAKTGKWLGAAQPSAQPLPAGASADEEEAGQPAADAADVAVQPPAPGPPPEGDRAEPPSGNSRVFIAHGKNMAVVEQLKDLLKFGKFEPVVAEEHETISKGLPEKVLDEMRSCSAGVIHVEGEEQLTDGQGRTVHKLNENVLIEIGAAMALYGDNFLLLVQEGVHLPSNLQGKYRYDYTGEKLDYEATMKLLKAFNDFR